MSQLQAMHYICKENTPNLKKYAKVKKQELNIYDERKN
jgi:hypothetical protein